MGAHRDRGLPSLNRRCCRIISGVPISASRRRPDPGVTMGIASGAFPAILAFPLPRGDDAVPLHALVGAVAHQRHRSQLSVHAGQLQYVIPVLRSTKYPVRFSQQQACCRSDGDIWTPATSNRNPLRPRTTYAFPGERSRHLVQDSLPRILLGRYHIMASSLNSFAFEHSTRSAY